MFVPINQIAEEKKKEKTQVVLKSIPTTTKKQNKTDTNKKKSKTSANFQILMFNHQTVIAFFVFCFVFFVKQMQQFRNIIKIAKTIASKKKNHINYNCWCFVSGFVEKERERKAKIFVNINNNGQNFF